MENNNIMFALLIGIALLLLGSGIIYYIVTNKQATSTLPTKTKSSPTFPPTKRQLSLLPPLYYINLAHRKDRKSKLTRRLRGLRYPDEKIIRVDAVLNKENGNKGCLESHIKTLKMGLKSGAPVIMVVEDDIVFLEDARTTFGVITEQMEQKGWNVLLLDCGGIKEAGPLNKNKRLRWAHKSKKYLPGCSVTTGYIIRREYIPVLLELWESTVGIADWDNNLHSCDQSWKSLQDETWIVLAPKLATQDMDHSDIANREVTNNRDSWERGPDGLPIELAACQRKMTGMLRTFDKICKDNGIEYWAMAGTLLGIVRHKGWIPYDGDLDVGMLQENYDKFRRVAWQLPENLWLQDHKSDPKHTSHHMGKIRDKHSCYIEYIQREGEAEKHNGLQLDIFLFKRDKDKLVTGFSTNFIQHPKITDVFPLGTGLFEGMEIPIPRDSHKWLKTQFGDYMKLLPKDKRYPHEGACWAHKTCPEHPNLYPHLYPHFQRMLAVSGYWDLRGGSKKGYGNDKYVKNFRHTTNFNTDYIIYGDEETTSHIKDVRGDKPTITRKMSWRELVHKCETEFDRRDILRTIEKTSLHDDLIHCPSAKLLLVWLSKVILVKDAMTLYPGYSHYGWIDAGYKGNIIDPTRVWPTADLSDVTGLYVRRLGDTCKDQYWERGPKLERCTMGGMWFGDKDSVREFTEICIEIIKGQLATGGTVCNDQHIFELATREMQIEVNDVGGNNYSAIFLTQEK